MDPKKCIKIRGTATYYEDDHSFEFQSQKEGKPQRKNVKKFGLATAYETTGSDPKTVLTLQCPNTTTDKRAELVKQFNDYLNSELQTPPKEQIKLKGCTLMNDEDAKMSIDYRNNTLSGSFILSLVPDGNLDFKNKFYDIIQKLSKCFVINQTSIAKSAKSSSQKTSQQ